MIDAPFMVEPVGRLGYVTLDVADLERATAFLSALLGHGYALAVLADPDTDEFC